MKRLLILFPLFLSLAACNSGVKRTLADGSVEEVGEDVAIMQQAAAVRAACAQRAGMVLSADQIAGLSASAQAEYMKALPVIALSDALRNATGGDQCGSEVAAYYRAKSNTAAAWAGVARAGLITGGVVLGVGAVADVLTAGYEAAQGTSYTTNVGDVNLQTAGGGNGAEGGVGGAGGGATMNFGGVQATDGSTLVNGEVGNYLGGGAVQQRNEKGTIGDGDLNDQQDGQGATNEGLL